MREIKFRGLYNNEWRFWNASNGDTGFWDIFGVFDDPKKTLGQFTGLYDKNKKEIWESDIVREVYLGNVNPNLNKYRYIVVKESKNGGSWDEISHGHCEGSKRPSWEVIGNIYENPELLKEPT